MKKFVISAAAMCALSGAANASVVFDQTTSVYANRFVSQIFTDPTYDQAYDAGVVDDFTLASATHLTSVSAALVGFTSGFVSFDAIKEYRVQIYSSQTRSAKDLVGDLYSYTIGSSDALVALGAFTVTGRTDQTALVTIPIDVALNAGTYFLSVFALDNDAVNGEVAVATSGAGDSVIANPGGGYNQGNPIQLGQNAGYSLAGDVAAVPEPASWAMFIGGFGLIGATMRRRKVAVSFA